MSKKIIFSKILPNNYNGFYTNYLSTSRNEIDLNFIDISKYAIESEKIWVTQLDEWHSKLSKIIQNKTWIWWLMPGSRITTLGYPYNLKPLFFSLGVIDYLEKNIYSDFFIIGLPNEASEYIKEWNSKQEENKKYIIYDNINKNIHFNLKRYKYIISSFKYFILLFFNSLFHSNKNKDKIDLMVFSIMLNPNSISIDGDHYFGKIFEEKKIQNYNKIDWFYLSTRFKYIKKAFYNSKNVNRDISFNFNWLSILDFIKILNILIKSKMDFITVNKELPNLKINNFDSSLFTKNFFEQTVMNYIPVKEVALYIASKNYIIFKKPKTLIYPYEQKPIERALLQACVDSHLSIKTIAYAHAIYNNGHRYIFNFKNLFKPYPNILATTGPASTKWFVNIIGWDIKKIVCLGSPRFNNIKINNNDQLFSNKLKILLLISFPYELENMSKWCESSSSLFDNCELMIRVHPYAWYREQEYAICRIKKMGIQIIDSTRTLNDEINWANLCLFCSTSAGIEAMLNNKLVIRVGLDDFFNINPLVDKDGGSDIMSASDPLQLKYLINHVIKMNISEINRIKEIQYFFAKQIYSNFSIDTVMNLLN